ncbi:hypothetical protein D3C87_1080590 [compost metagenome]
MGTKLTFIDSMKPHGMLKITPSVFGKLLRREIFTISIDVERACSVNRPGFFRHL